LKIDSTKNQIKDHLDFIKTTIEKTHRRTVTAKHTMNEEDEDALYI